MDDASVDMAEGSAAAAARLRDEIAGAAASSNSYDPASESADGPRRLGKILSRHHKAYNSIPPSQGAGTAPSRRTCASCAKSSINADVLLEVLDARDPLGCRSLETERMLPPCRQNIVLILNKIDLVPKSNVEAWLRYLRHDFPTLAFKASTQSQRTNLSQGANAVNYSKPTSAAGPTSSRAGPRPSAQEPCFISSRTTREASTSKPRSRWACSVRAQRRQVDVINSLKRARVCSVASTPGHTKVVQSVMLDKSVRLLDCPGIVFSTESASGAASLGLSAGRCRCDGNLHSCGTSSRWSWSKTRLRPSKPSWRVSSQTTSWRFMDWSGSRRATHRICSCASPCREAGWRGEARTISRVRRGACCTTGTWVASSTIPIRRRCIVLRYCPRTRTGMRSARVSGVDDGEGRVEEARGELGDSERVQRGV